jgi:hypothetical protein
MAATAPVGEISKRVIDPGTADGFCLTYPKGQPPVSCDELSELHGTITARNTGSFGVSCVSSIVDQGGHGSDVVVLAGCAWILLWRRVHGRRA